MAMATTTIMIELDQVPKMLKMILVNMATLM